MRRCPLRRSLADAVVYIRTDGFVIGRRRAGISQEPPGHDATRNGATDEASGESQEDCQHDRHPNRRAIRRLSRLVKSSTLRATNSIAAAD